MAFLSIKLNNSVVANFSNDMNISLENDGLCSRLEKRMKTVNSARGMSLKG